MTSLLFTTTLLVRLPRIRACISGGIIRDLSSELGKNVCFSGVRLHPFHALILEGIEVVSESPEPSPGKLAPAMSAFFMTSCVSTEFACGNLFGDGDLRLDRIVMSGTRVGLILRGTALPLSDASASGGLSEVFHLRGGGPGEARGRVFGVGSMCVRGVKFSVGGRDSGSIPFGKNVG